MSPGLPVLREALGLMVELVSLGVERGWGGGGWFPGQGSWQDWRSLGRWVNWGSPANQPGGSQCQGALGSSPVWLDTPQSSQMDECGLGAALGRGLGRAASSTCCIQRASVCISQPGRWGLTQEPGVTSAPATTEDPPRASFSLFQHGQFLQPSLVSRVQSPAVSAPTTFSCGQGAQRGQQGAQDTPRELVAMWPRSHLLGPRFSHLSTRAGGAVVVRGQ